MSLLAYVYAYILGGITFIPILVISFVYFHPEVEEERQRDESLKAGEIEEQHQTGLETYKTGWITVTQDYLDSLDELNSSTQPITDSSDNKSAYSTLYKLIQKENTNGATEQKERINKPPPEKVKTAHKKHRYFAILKHGNLFLYKNEKLTDVKHVVVLSNQIVTIWPPGLPDGQLFAKNSAICIMKRDWSRARRLSDNFNAEKITTSDILNKENILSPPKGSIFIYCDINMEKEDWYFALIRSTKSDGEASELDPNIHAKTLHFETSSMIDLIQTLYSSEGQLQTKWINALIGRVFLSLQKTDILESFLQRKIEKKLDKIKKPGFLDTFQIKSIYSGDSAPFITYPKLREINPNGSVVISSYIHYHGNLSLKIATKVNINLGSRFKTREVDVVLNITFEKLEGPILIKVKPPPSGRIWYSFEIMPVLGLKIEPIVSSRQLSYNIITNQIEKKFKDAIKDSLVLPHWDDFVFSDTSDEIYRGGIWEKPGQEIPSNPDNSTNIDIDIDSDLNSLIDSNAEISNLSPRKENFLASETRSGYSRQKLTNTITDLSKKIKKQKSTHTIGVSDHNYLSDGSFVETPNRAEPNSSLTEKKNTINTLKKIGKWYFKDGANTPQQESYTPPDMIVNRRVTRKPPPDLQKGDDSEFNNGIKPLYDFVKFPEETMIHSNHGRTSTLSSGYSFSSIDNYSNNVSSKGESVRTDPFDDFPTENPNSYESKNSQLEESDNRNRIENNDKYDDHSSSYNNEELNFDESKGNSVHNDDVNRKNSFSDFGEVVISSLSKEKENHALPEDYDVNNPPP